MSRVGNFARQVARAAGQSGVARNFAGKAENFAQELLDKPANPISQEVIKYFIPLECDAKNFWVEQAENRIREIGDWKKIRNLAISKSSEQPQDPTKREWLEALEDLKDSQQQGRNTNPWTNCFAGTVDIDRGVDNSGQSR